MDKSAAELKRIVTELITNIADDTDKSTEK